MGTCSDPWDYDPESVFNGQKKLSTYRNHLSLVRPFDKQMPRTNYGSIYKRHAGIDKFADPLVPTAVEQQNMRIRCASEARQHSSATKPKSTSGGRLGTAASSLNPRRNITSANQSSVQQSNKTLTSSMHKRHKMMTSATQDSSRDVPIDQVNYMDFLPNSIIRSPQRSSCSHTLTTQRLGLTKANRIGAIQPASNTSFSTREQLKTTR